MNREHQPPGALGAHLIDMRRFGTLTREAIPGGDFLSSRHQFDLSDSDTSLGTIDLGISSGSVSTMIGDEFVVVLDGALDVIGEVDFRIGAGESAVLPNGTSFSWKTDRPTLMAFIRHSSRSSAVHHPFKNDPAAPRVPAPPQTAELLIGPQPTAFWNLEYVSEGGRFTAGSWDGSPFHRRDFTYSYFELIHFIEGAVDFADDDGGTYEFTAGDVIAVRKGARLGWRSDVTVAKVAALCRTS